MVLENGMLLSNRYEILEKIGVGGMAIVYKAKDKKLERYVTVKVLREEFTSDEEFKIRFKIEARSAASLSHPNIVNVYDVGEDGNIYYIVMEYVNGDTLKKAIIEKAPFDTKSTINVAIQMASALSHAHKNHIVHRDIKPQNILVANDGMIKVTDFGIARAATAATVTTTANAIGSVHYFSPEQARGGYVDEKSDIYSLGITMFEMITGKLPYDGDNSVSIALKHINEELPEIRQYNPNVSKSLEGIIKKATRKRADERYANIDLLLSDLIQARSDSSGDFIVQPPPNSTEAPTVEMTPKELEYIQGVRRKTIMEQEPEIAYGAKKESEIEIPKGLFNKKIQISKDDDYEEPYYDEPDDELTDDEIDYEEPYYEESDDNYEELDEKIPRRMQRNLKRPSKSNYKENEYDVYSRKQEKMVVAAAVITAAIIIIVISVVGIKFLGGSNDSPPNKTVIAADADANTDETINSTTEKKKVPSFEGKDFDSAKKEAEVLGFTLVKGTEEYNADYDMGQIISQSPEEGEEVTSGTKINVIVSLGIASSDMPNVKGKDAKEASSAIQALIGKEPQLEYEYSEEEVGKIISQQPLEGTKITSESTIILTASRGEEMKKVPVPEVEGKSLEEAKKDLEALELRVGNVTELESAKVEKGIVITQTIKAGEEVMRNSIVNLVVSKGKKEEPAEQTKPAESQEPQEKPSEPEKENLNNTTTLPKTSTRVFDIKAPSGAASTDTVHVKILKIDSDGATTVVLDTQKTVSELPAAPVHITGSGKSEIQCYIDDVLQWSENVDFSEGGN